jgi:hypothetical protein
MVGRKSRRALEPPYSAPSGWSWLGLKLGGKLSRIPITIGKPSLEKVKELFDESHVALTTYAATP